MLTNKGFTLVEVLFSLSIIIVLSSITLNHAINNKPKITMDQQCSQIISFIEKAKSRALLIHQQVDITITSNQISYGDNLESLRLNDGYYFSNDFDFHFNKNGNISSGGHLQICNQEICKSIIFNVGNGAFYVK